MANYYSRRTGLDPVPEITRHELSDRLRSKLWDAFYEYAEEHFFEDGYSGPVWSREILRTLWVDYLAFSRDEVPRPHPRGLAYLNNTFKVGHFAEVFDLLEIMFALLVRHRPVADPFARTVNKHFEWEAPAHRMIAGQIVDSVSSEEIKELQIALDGPQAIRSHVEKALKLLYNRDHPDYKVAITESVSAIEAAVRHLTGGKETLTDGLKELDRRGVRLHPALREALVKLYGFAGDEPGLRHSESEGEKSDLAEAEARLILVTCSAITNYLVLRGA